MNSLLAKLIALPTLSTNTQGNEEALAWCQNVLRQKGIAAKIEWKAGHPTLGWGAPATTARILCNTHIDVVPASKDCFIPRVKNGRLLGRGAADTKAMVSVFLSLSAAEVRVATQKGIRFVLVSDEELGGESTRQLMRELPKGEFGFFGEPTQLQFCNEAKGIMQVEIQSLGKSSHGSQPWQGENAILDMSQKLQRFLSIHPLSPKPTWDTTWNFSLIQGGTAINQVPDSCTVSCDIRLPPTSSVQQALMPLEKIFGKKNIQIRKSESCIWTPLENSYLQTLREVAKTIDLPFSLRREFGSSDARHFTAAGIPSVVFGPVGGDLHQETEWVDLQSIQTARKFFRKMLQTL